MTSAGTAGVDLTGDPAADDGLYAQALACTGDVDAALSFARRLATDAPAPATGRALSLWQRFATVAAADPTVARIVEPHLDALAVLDELPGDLDLAPLGVDHRSTWGVFAAEGSGLVLEASPTPDGTGWRLDGAKPWCSLGDRLSHALVTARVSDGERRLFAVALDGRVRARPGAWFARGLAHVPSGPLDFDASPAVPIGETGWYLQRPGFAWGGIGVAAIWWGAAVGVARALRQSIASGAREPDQIALMHLGRVDTELWSARAVLREAAALVDGGPVSRDDARLLAARVRGVVAATAESVLRSAGHALGPAPLALDDRHAGRVADLELYLRQHHAERDDAALGRLLTESGSSW